MDDIENIDAWDKFEVVKHADGMVTFKSCHGAYIRANGDGETMAQTKENMDDIENIDAWDKYKVIYHF